MEEVEVKPSMRGGYRPGSGRKPDMNAKYHGISSMRRLRKEAREQEEAKAKEEGREPSKHSMSEAYDLRLTLRCPKRLTGEALAKWDEIMLYYAGLKTEILCTLDTSLLIAFCQSWSRYCQAQSQYDDAIGTDDLKSVRCYQSILKDETMLMNTLSDSLCLSPKARAKSGYYDRPAKKTEDGSALASFFGSGR